MAKQISTTYRTLMEGHRFYVWTACAGGERVIVRREGGWLVARCYGRRYIIDVAP